MTKFFSQWVKGALKRNQRFFSAGTNGAPQGARRPPWKVLFFGSDHFSLYSLKALYHETCHSTKHVISTVEVVTCSQKNPIWKFCRDQKLAVHKWPPDLQGQVFDLGIVVSFGYLIPEGLINKFPLGMLNVHASLLPRWRGASPIVYAIANGDTKTGVTIMRIRPRKFDVGEILHQEAVPIAPDIEMPQLHAILGQLGANSLVQTLANLNQLLAESRPQPAQGVTYAPKITPEFAQVKWTDARAKDIHQLYRALKSISPLTTTWNGVPVKLSEIAVWQASKTIKQPGSVEYSKKDKALIVECASSTWISVKQVGVQGKKPMKAADFYNGFISKLDDVSLACFK